MSIVERYLAYADDFEKTYADDDWDRLTQYFTEDATYTGEPEDAHGRAAVLAKLRAGVDAFDRQMDSRRIDFAAPRDNGGTVEVRWAGTYTKSGCPDLILTGEEFAEFEGDRIRLLRDVIDPAAASAMGEWMTAHGSKLGG